MLKAVVEFAAYGVAATLAAVCILACAWKWSGWTWTAVSRQLRRSALAVMVAMAVVATMKAQKGNRGNGTTGDPPAPVQQTGTTGVSPVEDITDTFHFSAIAVSTNGTVTLTTAWTNGLLTAGQTIDILVKTDLRDERWTWITNGVVEAGSTNMSWTIEDQSPSNSFYKAVVRDTLADMDDPDGDGIPNVYEFHHGRSPWVPDSALVQKRTVGPNGEFGDIVSALAASEDYSIIAVTSGVYQVNHDIQMPPRPVMVTCEDGYAVFSGATSRAMFLLGKGHENGHTLFRDLYLDLTSTSGMQAGFWCGGGLPWTTPGAAAVFENVHVRAPNPGVEYFGWLFYAPCDAPAVIRGCCVNASGAEWIYAIFGDNPPPIVVESCTFVNFPTQSVYQSTAIGLRSTYANGAITSTPPVAVSRVLFDASFTNAWPLARFENAGGFPVTMTDCIRPSEPASSDFMADVTNNIHIVTSEVAWAGFPLANSPAALLGIGAFAPIPSNSLDDTDHDTLLDYNEVYDRGLDPFLADTDNDGVSDSQEISDGTDPADPHSFKQTLTVTVTNMVSTASTVYTAWGISDAGWEANGQTAFPEGFGTTNYIDALSQGATHIKAFCDLNGNGVFDSECDILRVQSIPLDSMAQVKFVFGDVDGDGVSDAQERQQDTDPYDGNNFRLVATVKIESSDVAPGLTNFVAWSYSAAGWEPNDLARFAGSSLPFQINVPVMGGELFVKVFRDFNTNGVYDVDVDALVSNRLTWVHNGKTVTFNIGDSDGDGVVDSVEMGEGTNPLNNLDYCFNLSLTYTGVFQTTNALTFAASFGTNRVYGPCVVEGSVWTNDFGHRATTTGERVSVDVWDDANQNGDWDVGETSNKYVIAVTGHDMVVTNTLSYLNFDRNNNEIPDWWDAQNGLDAEGVAYRAYDDPDGDGLINLHEFWCGTHPFVPDGWDTLLSVAARSIDSRIWDIDPVTAIPRFTDFDPKAAVNPFTLNENFWARDLDLSCVSVWNNGSFPETQAATLITRKHVVMASHWWNNGEYKFCDTNGQICTRSIVRWDQISDDLQLGQLDDALPSSFKPASVMSTNYVSYLSTGKYLPTLCLNQEKGATVLELEDLNCRALETGGSWHSQYGKNSMTNYVSIQRNNIRGATLDGNSGCPVLLVFGNNLVLLFSKHLGWPGTETWSPFWGPTLSFRLEAIQNKINEWEGPDAGQYQIVPFDLSAYPKLVNQR